MIEEIDDQDESTHKNTGDTDEEAQDICPAFDNNPDQDVDNIEIEEDDYKGTFIHFLTSPLLTYSPPVHIYSLSHLCTIPRDHT
jgi:hypothetical protein